MIVVTIIGVLASIAIPKFANLIRKAMEGSSKGNLGAIRSALSVYYADLEGQYPARMLSLTVGGKYIRVAPLAKAPNYHDESVLETNGLVTAVDGAGGWYYDNVAGDAFMGTLYVNCTHTDTKGTVWTLY
jgi:general secretion pathway protein G